MELSQLPNELLVHLFKFFDHSSLMRFLLTNHHYHNLIISNRKHFAYAKYRSIRICAGRKPTEQFWPNWETEMERLPAPYSIHLTNSNSNRLPITYFFDSPAKIMIRDIQIREQDQYISQMENEKIVYCKSETEVKIFVYTVSPSDSLIAHLKKILQYADVKKLIFDEFLISDKFLSSFLPIITEAPKLSFGTLLLKWCALYDVTPEGFINFFSTISPSRLEVHYLCTNAPFGVRQQYFDDKFWKTPKVLSLKHIILKNDENGNGWTENVIQRHPFMDKRLFQWIERSREGVEMKKIAEKTKISRVLEFRVEDIERNLEAWIDGEQSIVEWRLFLDFGDIDDLDMMALRFQNQGHNLAPPDSSYLQLKNCTGDQLFLKYRIVDSMGGVCLVVQKHRF